VSRDHLPLSCEVRLRAAVGSISGCHVEQVRPRFATRPVKNGHLHLHVATVGWSPSLHKHKMSWRLIVTSHGTDDEMWEALTTVVRPYLDIQRRRLEAGVELGRAAPFEVSNIDSADIEHIVMDRGLAALLPGHKGESLRSLVTQAVYNLHSNHGGGLDDELDNTLFGTTLLRSVEIGDGLIYNGENLWIREPLLETIATAVVGRRLGDLVAVPSCLAEHVITHTVDADLGTEVHVAPLLATIAEISPRTIFS